MAQNLASKYRPHKLEDMVEQSVIVDIVNNMCKAGDVKHRNMLFIGPAGCGKAQPLDSQVLTPYGYTEMRNVVVGTEVITGSGERAKVQLVFPQGDRDIYKIVLDDGSEIRVADNHLNCVHSYDTKGNRVDYVLETTDLVSQFNAKDRDNQINYAIDTTYVPFSELELPLDPYLVGAFLRCGVTSPDIAFNIDDRAVIKRLNEILLEDHQCYLEETEPGSNVWEVYSSLPIDHHIQVFDSVASSLDEVSIILESMGYPKYSNAVIQGIIDHNPRSRALCKFPELGNITQVYATVDTLAVLKKTLKSLKLTLSQARRTIPEQYLYSSSVQRYQLLCGIVPHVEHHNQNPFYSTTSKQLSHDVALLARSLGIKDKVSSVMANSSTDEHRHKEYIHEFIIPRDLENAIFTHIISHSSRPQAGSFVRPSRSAELSRNIVDIQYLGQAECQCIYVDHPEHTYISDDYIPTHNTTIAKIISTMLNGSSENCIEIDAASYNGAEAMRNIMNQAHSYPVGTKYKVFIIDECHSLSSAAWQVALKTIEDQPAKSIFVWCTTNPEKIPATIISRVQSFQLSKISLEGIYSRLKYIIEQENAEGRGIVADDDAILYISKLAGGGMRDAITLLDKSLSYSKVINIENLHQALGLPNYEDYFDLLNAIAKKNNERIVEIINQVYNSGVNFTKWFDGFFAFVTNIVKYIYLKDINQTMIPSIYQDKISGYSTAHAALCLKLSNKLVTLNQELKTSQYLQELAISHLCTPPAK